MTAPPVVGHRDGVGVGPLLGVGVRGVDAEDPSPTGVGEAGVMLAAVKVCGAEPSPQLTTTEPPE